MRDPWLLFITTDARLENLSSRVLDALKEAIRMNAVASQDFMDGAVTCMATEECSLEEAFAYAEADPERFVAMFSLGLSKWLLHNANAQGWNVKSKSLLHILNPPPRR